MQELIRLVLLFLIALFVVFHLVQCRSVFPEMIDHPKSLLSDADLIELCMFRKSRLCNYLHKIDADKLDRIGDDRELWRRGVSHFYSNW